jgi:hypothetical protein
MTDLAYARPAVQLDTRGTMALSDSFRDIRRYQPTHNPLCHLDDSDQATSLPGTRRQFQTDEPGANHYYMGSWNKQRMQVQRIGKGS